MTDQEPRPERRTEPMADEVSGDGQDGTETTGIAPRYRVLLVVAWTLVALLLGYGVVNIVITASQLFTG
ncbi:MFS transporter small subunit [Allonocardiopsis opalescens]|uniref:Uncharacterized protein n=1 Tax=Allonocardiopsis opalescens TaxID=1144618 RepID=A0A2T0PV96_9ACTN|nr:hypothetical protein [Allonocardiopsis opalescens]PRX95451.1 hypothetical protein CLV72_10959 [Allonocardiopsis opalescens]